MWGYLSNDEATDIIAHLHNQTQLHLTTVEDASEWDNTSLIVDVLAPNKTDIDKPAGLEVDFDVPGPRQDGRICS
ncbi:hypothetical protein L204_102167 [Cryptococcus depauperatus]